MLLYKDDRYEVYGAADYRHRDDIRIQVINRKAYEGVVGATPMQLEYGKDKVVQIFSVDDSPITKGIADQLWKGKGNRIRKGKVE